MFVGYFEISTNVIVKHVQSIGIIRAFCLPGGTEEISGLWFARERGRVVSTQVDTMLCLLLILNIFSVFSFFCVFSIFVYLVNI